MPASPDTTRLPLHLRDGDGLACVLDLNCLNQCPADLDGDEIVNINDLFLMHGAWGPCP